MSRDNKILIVDDESIIRLILEELLISDGYTVKSVSGGEDGLALLPSFDPDIILLDIQMPGMDGYSVCSAIRADERYHFTKIIMVSGCTEVQERLRGYDAGADDYLSKPFDDQELLAKVRVYTRLKRREEVDQVKGDLLTLLTHETRTPINGIIGCADILLGEDSLADEHREFVELIRQSSTQLHGFLENCLLLSKLKAGVELVKSYESIGVILEAVCQNLASVYKGKCSFNLQVDRQLLLYADWQLLQRAFEFLIDNSMKYSPQDGLVEIVVLEEDELVIIRIDDCGVGVDPHRRQEIFDEFSIQDVAHHQNGQGISLAISHRICTCHGGDIKVSETPTGSGARFEMMIPKVEKSKHE